VTNLKTITLWQFIGVVALVLSAQVALIVVPGGRDLTFPIFVLLALFIACEVSISWALFDALKKARRHIPFFLQVPIVLPVSVGLALALVFVANSAFFHADFSVFVVAALLQLTVRLVMAGIA